MSATRLTALIIAVITVMAATPYDPEAVFFKSPERDTIRRSADDRKTSHLEPLPCAAYRRGDTTRFVGKEIRRALLAHNPCSRPFYACR